MIVAQMTENAEKAYIEQISTVDVEAIDTRLAELGREMAALVKLNLTTGVNTEGYAVEYNRINSEMEEWKRKRAVVTDVETIQRENLGRVQEVDYLMYKTSNSRSIFIEL